MQLVQMAITASSEASVQDPYLTLLTYRTTPVDSNLASPSQLIPRTNTHKKNATLAHVY